MQGPDWSESAVDHDRRTVRRSDHGHGLQPGRESTSCRRDAESADSVCIQTAARQESAGVVRRRRQDVTAVPGQLRERQFLKHSLGGQPRGNDGRLHAA